MRPSDFDYELPPERIAQWPAARREDARLLVHDRTSGSVQHARVGDLARFLAPGDLLVVNDTRVVPARLHGRRASGGRVELLLAERRPGPGWTWSALVRPARRLAPGEHLSLEAGFVAILGERLPAPEGGPSSVWAVAFEHADGPPIEDDARGAELLERAGRMPLPPYVERSREARDAEEPRDRERYQTVYARVPGAVAAPTAGLHLTPQLLGELGALGVESARVTLHVGLGTFLPVRSDSVEEHRMHAERYRFPPATAEAVRACRARGGRVVAVGTTTVRVLETCAREDGEVRAGSGATDLFLVPGHRFRAVDALLTNFHLPRSTLLMLVSAFAARERVLALYAEAVRRGYRFYSYGDAMLIT